MEGDWVPDLHYRLADFIFIQGKSHWTLEQDDAWKKVR